MSHRVYGKENTAAPAMQHGKAHAHQAHSSARSALRPNGMGNTKRVLGGEGKVGGVPAMHETGRSHATAVPAPTQDGKTFR